MITFLKLVKAVRIHLAFFGFSILCFSFQPIGDSVKVFGYIKGAKSGQIIVTLKDLAITVREDTINVYAGNFSYEAPLKYPHIIEFKYNNQAIESFIDPGTTLRFLTSVDSFSSGSFEGSKTENERKEREHQKVSRFAVEKPMTSIDSLLLSFTIDSLWSMEHRQSYLTLMTLVSNIYDFRFTDVLQIYNTSPDNYKKSILGQKLLALIRELKPTPVGSSPPGLIWKDVNGKKKSLKELRNEGVKYALLDFWGSYCIPCIENIPLLKKIDDKYRPIGLRIVSISVDKDEAAWRKRMSEEKMDQWITGIEIAQNTIEEQMGIEIIPSYFIIDLRSWIIIGRFNTRSLRQGRAERLLDILLE
ncbi:MAG: TlpA family protein disulfide reductase [Chitinophagaceae bacterium]